jgi:hypothetical protein
VRTGTSHDPRTGKPADRRLKEDVVQDRSTTGWPLVNGMFSKLEIGERCSSRPFDVGAAQNEVAREGAVEAEMVSSSSAP